MSRNHEEGSDMRILARTGRVRVDERMKSLRMSKDALVGIRTWGRIDLPQFGIRKSHKKLVI
jgi:hypothetical protein